MEVVLKEKILLFIPAYNCEKQIVRVLKSINSEILEYITEIIVVNNRSTDNTEQSVVDYMKEHEELPIKLLRNCENYGLGGSHKVAFQYAISNNCDFVIVLHGDDQGDIMNILPILKDRKHLEYDCCLGARFMKGSRLEGYSYFRTIGNRVFNLIYSIVTGIRVYDLGSGLNIYNTNILKDKFYFKFADNLVFNVIMLLASVYYRHKILFFPITWKEEDQISNVKMFRQACNTFKLAFKYLLNKNSFLQSEHRTFPKKEYTAQCVSE